MAGLEPTLSVALTSQWRHKSELMKIVHLPKSIIAYTLAIMASLLTGKARADLFVTSQTPPQMMRFDGVTGAFVSASSATNDLTDVTVGPDGNLYVAADTQVLHFDSKTGNPLGVFVSGINGAISLTFGPDGNLYVSLFNQILRFDGHTGAFIDVFASDSNLAFPRGLTFGPDGNLYVANYNTASVLRYNGTKGTFIDTFVSSRSGGLFTPGGLDFGPDGNLYVSGGTYPFPGIYRFNGQTGAFIDLFASGPVANLAPLKFTFGPDNNLYVVTQGALDAVLRYNGTNGSFIDYFVANGSGGLSNPYGLAFSPEPPVISCPDPVTVTLGSPAEVTATVRDPGGAALTVLWNVNGATAQTNNIPAGALSVSSSVSFSSELPLGTNDVSVTVTDTASNSVSCSTTVTVVEPPPPVIVSASASPSSLWPPDHKFVQVTISAQVDDTNSPSTWKITSVTSNQDGNGNRPFSARWIITGDHTVQLLAERLGNTELVYTITIQASDAFGNLSQVVNVDVPVLKDLPDRLSRDRPHFKRDL